MTSTAYAANVTHYYTISVDYSLNRLSVEARFSHPVSSITARSRSAGRFLSDVRGCGKSPNIRMRNRRMMLPDGGIRCLNYTVDLDRVAKEYRGAKNLSAQNIVASPSYWMWRPELTNGNKIHVTFRMPESVQVSVPWQPIDADENTYIVGGSPESANAPAIFGKFDYREIEVPGSVIRLSIVSGDKAMNNEAIARWIRATTTDVSLVYGRFPNPSPQVVVYPASSSRGGVGFGRVVRDGGESVELLINPDDDVATFFDEWTATHEFSHMLLPYLSSEYHWISEGFSQYYQNILLTRVGTYDAERMWQNLYAGFERGRKSHPELSPNQATSGSIRSSRMKVYWSGAALALMADVELRERSNGEESLDDVLDRLQACCLPSTRTWSGLELFAQLDTLIDEPLFVPLYRRYADTAGFPDTSEVYSRLGLGVAGDKVRIKRNGELKSIRDAMTVTDYPTAQRRRQLAAN
ncbi:MAG: hypothetical protein HOM16_14345 [Woeseia sp.]|nr:hypothetical protein [Woeseia sp.]